MNGMMIPRLTPTTTKLAMGARQTSYGAGMTIDGDPGDLPVLTDLIDAVADLERREDAQDLQLAPSGLVFRFGEEVGAPHHAHRVTARGMADDLIWTRTAFSQLAQRVLPARGGAFLLDLAERNPESKLAGFRLATMAMAEYMRTEHAPLTFRTVRDEVTGRRMVRGVVSAGYNTYADSSFLGALRDGLPDGHSDRWRVISAQVTSDVTRFRLLDVAKLDGGRIDRSAYHPVITGWNSQVGRRAVYLEDGSYRWVCFNGMGSWDGRYKYRWNHTGEASRISRGVRSAVDSIGAKAAGVVDAYNAALETAIDDAWAWFEDNARDAGVHQREIEQIADFTTSDTVSRDAAGQPRLLASVVDYVTEAAHTLYPDDLLEQERLEKAGASLLRKGIRTAKGKRLTAPVRD